MSHESFGELKNQSQNFAVRPMMIRSLHYRATISRFVLPLLVLLKTTNAGPNYIGPDCPDSDLFTPNSTYEANLRTLLSLLSANATASVTGFHNSSVGTKPPDIAYGLFLCRGDVSPEVCGDCISTAAKESTQKCPQSKAGLLWYDECTLRYSDRPVVSVMNDNGHINLKNTQNVKDPEHFQRVLGSVFDFLVYKALAGEQSGKIFAAGGTNFSATDKLYGLTQCTPDLTEAQCTQCLRNGISTLWNCCSQNTGAKIFFASCVVRYDMFPFFNLSAAVDLPQSPAPPPPPSSPPPSAGKGKGGISRGALFAIIVTAAAATIAAIIVGFCLLTTRTKLMIYNSIRGGDVISGAGDGDGDGDDITMEHSLQYDLGTIRAATNNFSDVNKIGEGGYGSVYKGLLPNGNEIAVKRLSKSSRQGAQEFKNEVVVVAKLQHRNLVRLCGFCLEGEEKILIYEFMPNKSLDYLLFDPQERAKLDWSTRFNIITGIARGMLYLHEDSRLRIIHRDLKASNILLDGNMNAKVSDFGMARIFGGDQTGETTTRVVGTFGYMPPEYARRGHYSVKSDVFSFGVLLLEIISGKRNNSGFQLSDCNNLPSYAWKLWKEGRPLDLIDDVLEGSNYSRSEVKRCIHLGLLCVQDVPDARPSMATVVLMLNSYSASLPMPQEPAFVDHSKTGLGRPKKVIESDKSTSQSMSLSGNNFSITDVYPR